MRQTAKISGSAVVAALALVLLASALAASTVSFAITGTGIGGSLDGIYTSPYQGAISGISGTVPVICDDFANNSYVPEDWTANVTSLSSINAGTDTSGDLKWNNANSNGSVDGFPAWDLGNQETAYDVAAYLAIQIMNTPAASTTSEDFSYALWELFDATGPSTPNTNANPNLPSNSDNVVSWLNGYPSDTTTLSAATLDVENAIKAVCGVSNCTTTGSGVTTLSNNVIVTALSGENVNIYTIVPGSTPICPDNSPDTCGSAPPQEFITVTAKTGMTYETVPEQSSLAVFAVYSLFGGASLLFFGRRRLLKSDSKATSLL